MSLLLSMIDLQLFDSILFSDSHCVSERSPSHSLPYRQLVRSASISYVTVNVFLSLSSYLIDSYVIYAASVLAANSVVRSLFGMAFPLFTPAMYQRIGVHWAPSLCCLLALICLPFPWIFEKHGKAIRMKCRFSKEAAEVLEVMLKGANAKYHDEENPTEVAANMELGMVRTTSNLSRMNSIRPQQSKVLQEQKRLSHHEEENSQNGHGKNTAQSSDHSSDLAH